MCGGEVVNQEFEEMLILMKKVYSARDLSLENKKVLIKQIFDENLHCVKSEDELKRLLHEINLPYMVALQRNFRADGFIIDKVEPDDILTWCVGHARCEVARKRFGLNYLGDCKQASQFVDQGLELLERDGVKNYKIDTSKVFGGNFQHTINIAEVQGKNYIIDPTFSQFLIYIYTFESLRELVPNKCIPVGAWFVSDEKNIPMIESLLRDGYIEATDDVVKRYFDCFVLANDSKRKNSTDRKVKYTAEDYLQMLGIEQEKCFGG